ncbi:hypothetical protein F2Q68_00006365 [Brassica cretica]|uniref:Uncharacterized protein n=2 Tax=Brassica cretica TaxID=69181 RepID=A0A8S9J619_BRACR|nr:hypothetical protein F2Q68_00006365 [Brassica cretica]KAF3544110.1 hypothetical protein DY000_02009800 [Brassica cretica]
MSPKLPLKNLKHRNSAKIEPSSRSEIDQPQSPKSRSDISPSLTTEGHRRVLDVEKSSKVEAQPTRLSDAPSRTARSSAHESHAPPPSTGVYVRAALAPPSPTIVFWSHRIRPPSACHQETATVSPPRLHCHRHRVCVHVRVKLPQWEFYYSSETDEHERLLPSTEPNLSPVSPKLPPGQLVTTCHVGGLLKGEVLGSRNAKRTNNLHEGSLGITGEGLGSVLCRPVWGPQNRLLVRLAYLEPKTSPFKNPPKEQVVTN